MSSLAERVDIMAGKSEVKSELPTTEELRKKNKAVIEAALQVMEEFKLSSLEHAKAEAERLSLFEDEDEEEK